MVSGFRLMLSGKPLHVASRTFPWGDEFPQAETETRAKLCISYRPCPVTKFGPYEPFKLFGTGSDVREWTSNSACDSDPEESEARLSGNSDVPLVPWPPLCPRRVVTTGTDSGYLGRLGVTTKLKRSA